MELSIKQNQKLVMNLAMRQAIQVLQMPIDELSNWLENEINQNPLLDLSLSKPQPSSEFQPAIEDTLQTFLKRECAVLFKKTEDHQISSLIIEALDEKGFLSISISELALMANTSCEQIYHIAFKISQLDPPGIATIDIQHSLLAQLEKHGKKQELCYLIIEKHWKLLTQNKLSQIASKLKVSLEAIKSAIHQDIRPLNLCPSSSFQKSHAVSVRPDIIIVEENDHLELYLPSDDLPAFTLHQSYLNSDETFVRKWLASAKWLERIIERRHRTLRLIGELLIEKQHRYFKGLENTPTPLRATQIAKFVGLSTSTITRALSNKYISTPRGLFPLNYFTSASTLNTTHHTQTIEEALIKEVEKEDPQNPYSDVQLAQRLANRGIQISRRTVAKYRKNLQIPNTFCRNKIRR